MERERKSRGRSKKILSQAKNLNELASSLPDFKTPLTLLLEQERSLSFYPEDVTIDWKNPAPGLIIIVKTFCDFGQGPEFIKAIRNRLNLDEETAEFAQEWMLIMLRRGNEDNLLAVTTHPIPPFRQGAGNLLPM
jgi:hypothetical protein